MNDTIRVGDVPEARVDLFAAPTPEETRSESALEGLRKALAAPVERGECTVLVPKRPGVKVRCHTNLTQEQRKAWQARARKKSRRGAADDVDEMLFAQLVLANTCVAISFNGIDAHDEEDTPLTFSHKMLWDMVGAHDPADAIRKLWANDAHVLLASGEVLLASGFDDDLEDPTQG